MLINKALICDMKNRRRKGGLSTITILILMLGGPATVGAQEIRIVNDLPAADAKTYFNIENGTVITGADTAGSNWDLAFLRTRVWVNSGKNRAGNTKAVLLKNTPFDKLRAAPSEGYNEDNDTLPAIPDGSGNGWYVYDMNNHTVSPAPGRVIVLKTGTGRFVKLEILNYYKDGDGDPGYYTFRYSFIEKAKQGI